MNRMSKEEFEEKLCKASEHLYNETLHCHKSPAQEIIDKLMEDELPPFCGKYKEAHNGACEGCKTINIITGYIPRESEESNEEDTDII